MSETSPKAKLDLKVTKFIVSMTSIGVLV